MGDDEALSRSLIGFLDYLGGIQAGDDEDYQRKPPKKIKAGDDEDYQRKKTKKTTAGDDEDYSRRITKAGDDEDYQRKPSKKFKAGDDEDYQRKIKAGDDEDYQRKITRAGDDENYERSLFPIKKEHKSLFDDWMKSKGFNPRDPKIEACFERLLADPGAEIKRLKRVAG